MRMSPPRSIHANDPLLFGRRSLVAPIGPIDTQAASIGQDLRLFAMTFTAGFLFVSIFLG